MNGHLYYPKNKSGFALLANQAAGMMINHLRNMEEEKINHLNNRNVPYFIWMGNNIVAVL